MLAKYRKNTKIDDTSLIFTETLEVATETPENTADVTRCIDPITRIINMAAARFGNESGEDSDESSCSEENVDDYESYGGVLGYQYEPKKRVRSPVAVRIEPGTEGASPSSIASDSDSRTRSGSVVQLVVALPPDTHSVPERAGNTDW